ncbi:MAG TPA: metal-dependent hydrolase [Candidatus Methylomirabilis sp.]|nr:metal-dependent hydrolase [Candidatus Methylomirabilis sp.]
MDTITHGIAGALIGKAVFRGDDLLTSRPMNRGRVITWSLMLGAVFPDSDMVREFVSHNPMLIMTWHRSITHSFVCMPVFALVLAGLTRAIVRWRKWDAPSFAALSGIYAIGILSHIFLDLVTSFGTMCWSPLKWSRPAWDLIFIIDFTFSAILLCPQMSAWVYRKPDGLKNRAAITWSIFSLASLGVVAVLKSAGAPTTAGAAVSGIAVLAALFLLPSVRGAGLRIRYATWNRVGLSVAVLYIAAAFLLHRSALDRVEKFAAFFQLPAESLGALPLPPSIWHWDGLVRTAHGVYEVRFDLSEPSPSAGERSSSSEGLASLEHRYYPDAPPNSYIDAARRLRQVQTVLWFSRFPVTRFHKEGDEAVVEFLDVRFARPRSDRSGAFTYRVRMDDSGKVISQGWAGR